MAGNRGHNADDRVLILRCILYVGLLLLALLPISVLLGGCFGAPSPIIDTRPSPFIVGTGSVRGFVLEPSGEKLKRFSVKVSDGVRFTFTGRPDPVRLVEPEVHASRSITVLHDFGDGRRVYAERHLRSQPIQISEAEEPNARTRAFKEKYVYLREGEFLLEEVPEGIITVVASLDGIPSEPVQVTVFPEAVAHKDVELALPVPVEFGPAIPRFVEPLDQHTPREIEAVQEAGSKGKVPILSPASVSVRLQAAPRSQGTVIKAIECRYQGKGADDLEVDWVVRVKIEPVVIPAAQDSAPGPVTTVELPIGAEPLTRLLAGSSDASAPVYPANVSVRIIDEQGFPVEVRPGQVLEIMLNIVAAPTVPK